MNVTRLPDPSPGVRRYRVSGPPTDAGWRNAVRPGHTAWCELTIRDGAVGSYGGEVWPSAWPDLFDNVPPSVQFGSGGFKVTAAGAAALDGAPETRHLRGQAWCWGTDACPGCLSCDGCGWVGQNVTLRGKVALCEPCQRKASDLAPCAPDGTRCLPCGGIYHHRCDACGADCADGTPGGPPTKQGDGSSLCWRCETARGQRHAVLVGAAPDLKNLVQDYRKACLCPRDLRCPRCQDADAVLARLEGR